MQGAGRSTRRRARQETLELAFTWRFAMLAAAVVVVASLCFGLWVAVLKVIGHPPTSTVRAFVGGIAVASALWGVALMLLRFDGSLSWRLGADGEESTADALRALGDGWEVFHNVPFAVEGGGEIDVDHIAVGPYGVLVIESKWSNQPIELNRRSPHPRVASAVRQATDNAGRVQAVLRGVVPKERIVPTVVFWGRRVTGAPPGDARIDDVRVARGSHIKDWPRRLAGRQNLTLDEREQAIARLHKLMDRHERARLARPGEVATTAALQVRARRWALGGMVLGLGAAAILGALAFVETDDGAVRWLVPLVGPALGILVPFLLLGTVAFSTTVGIQRRERLVTGWWRWPLVGLIGPVTYFALLCGLAVAA